MEKLTGSPKNNVSQNRTSAESGSVPSAQAILSAFNELGTQTSVATFFGVSRRTIDRWIKELNIHPDLRPEIPIRQLLSSTLSDSATRIKVAQWIIDEASISVAYHSRYDKTSLLLVGAMNDVRAMESMAAKLDVEVISGAIPPGGTLPMHVIRLQGSRAYCLLELLSNELEGLKASEAKAALAYFPPSGIVEGKVTTDVYFERVWRDFASESIEAWNKKRKKKVSVVQMESLLESWVGNRIARARRSLNEDKVAHFQSALT